MNIITLGLAESTGQFLLLGFGVGVPTLHPNTPPGSGGMWFAESPHKPKPRPVEGEAILMIPVPMIFGVGTVRQRRIGTGTIRAVCPIIQGRGKSTNPSEVSIRVPMISGEGNVVQFVDPDEEFLLLSGLMG